MSSWPTDFATPQGGDSGHFGSSLLPGGTIADGRYRLLSCSGVDQQVNAQLWRARDGQLGRDVALTVLSGNASDTDRLAAVKRTLERAMHAASFAHPGISRILDVIGKDSGVALEDHILGVVVAEWTNGTDLIDLIAEGPLPAATAARLIEPLAAAVEGAHHAGLVLGIGHPQHIRVTPEGQLRLAFPGPPAQATPRDDVKGLGAILYLLLTARWPLPNGPEGLAPAPLGRDGAVIAPRILQPLVPHALSTVAVRSLEDASSGGIRTGAALLRVLDDLAAAEAETELLSPAANDQDDGAVWMTKKPVKDPEQSRKLAFGVLALAVVTMLMLGWITFQVIGFFSDSSSKNDGGPELVLSQSASPSQTSSPAPRQTAGPIQPTGVAVYNIAGDPDNSARATLAIDNNPATGWRTDTYFQNFPALKQGVGLMVTFAQPVKLSQVIITSPSAGTKVEIRTAPADNPALAQTKIAGAATLARGDTTVSLQQGTASTRILIWVTGLSGSGKAWASELSELKFVAA